MRSKYPKWFQIVIVWIILAGSLLITLSDTVVSGQSPIPVQTQVWLDLTASAIAPTPVWDATATYEAVFQDALRTVTAEAASSTPAPTATPSAIQWTPTATAYPPGTATDQARYDVTATFRATITRTATAGQPYIPPELDSIKTKLTHVTGGTFMMGTTLEEASAAVDECALYDRTCSLDWISDSIPPHEMTVDDFEMEMFEVTLFQYVTFLNWMGSGSHLNGCSGERCVFTSSEKESSIIVYEDEVYTVIFPDFYNEHPVTWVTWYGAQAYCQSIGRRLPTEAEWEHAARGPQNLIYPWGDRFEVNFANSGVPEAEGTIPVADTSFTWGISAYGVYHMAGNVQEWVQDWYDPIIYTNDHAAHPSGPDEGSMKVLRGGSWDTAPLFLRTVHRRSASPASASAAIGFRCVADS